MMRIQDLGPKDVVHCDTEEKAKEILKLADEAGKRWVYGGRFVDCSKYSEYGSKTCYNFTVGQYASVNYYMREGCNIVSADQILAEFHPGIYWHYSDNVEFVYLESLEQMKALPGYCELVQRCEKPQPKMVKWTPSLKVPEEFWVLKKGKWIKHKGRRVVSTIGGIYVDIGTCEILSERIYVRNS